MTVCAASFVRPAVRGAGLRRDPRCLRSDRYATTPHAMQIAINQSINFFRSIFVNQPLSNYKQIKSHDKLSISRKQL